MPVHDDRLLGAAAGPQQRQRNLLCPVRHTWKNPREPLVFQCARVIESLQTCVRPVSRTTAIFRTENDICPLKKA